MLLESRYKLYALIGNDSLGEAMIYDNVLNK